MVVGTAFLMMFLFYGAWQIVAQLDPMYWVLFGVAALIGLPVALLEALLRFDLLLARALGATGLGVSDDDASKFKEILKTANVETLKFISYNEFLAKTAKLAQTREISPYTAKSYQFYLFYLYAYLP